MTDDDKIKKRVGRPRKEIVIDDTPKRPRGRPRKEVTVKPRWIKTGRPVGRPKLDPALRKPPKKRPYIPKVRVPKKIKPKKIVPIKKKRIREKPKKRKVSFLTFEKARELVYDEAISSAWMFKKWFKLHRPARLPADPSRVYRDEWKGWNYFLRNDNKNFYDARARLITYRPYEESRIYAQSLGLKIREEWFELCKSGKKPKDVPSRPDVVYRHDWISWRQFLGGSTIAHIETQQNSQKFIFVAKYEYMPHNVFKIDITNVGVESLKYYAREHKFKILKLYNMPNGEDAPTEFKKLVARYCEKWWEGEYGDYVCSEIYELLMELDIFYDIQPFT
jgi:hypothetical protein